MNRREAVVAVAALVAAPGLGAQSPDKRRIGVLLSGNPEFQKSFIDAFIKRLRELGWEDGKNVAIEFRFAENRFERLPELAQGLVARKAELLVAHSTCVNAARDAAGGRIPVIFTFVSDPVRDGYVQSLARPGGNMTGVKLHSVEYGPKQLELLKQLAPGLERVAWLAPPGTSEGMRRVGYENLEAAGRKLGVSILPFEAGTPQEIGAAFDRAAAARAGGMIVVPGSHFHQEAKTIADLAHRHRIATAFGDSLWVRAGGLVSYGIDFADLFARTAPYVDRVLKGAKPAELPVDQVERFVTAINRRTADALGLKIPRSLLVRVDEMID